MSSSTFAATRKKPFTAAAFSADGSVLAVAVETPIERLSFLGKSKHLVPTSQGSNPQVYLWNMSKLSVSCSYKLHAEAVMCSLDDSSFAVLQRLPESFKLKESNETTSQSKDGAILLFNVADPVPVALNARTNPKWNKRRCSYLKGNAVKKSLLVNLDIWIKTISTSDKKAAYRATPVNYKKRASFSANLWTIWLSSAVGIFMKHGSEDAMPLLRNVSSWGFGFASAPSQG
ncbi:hypothetical protein RHMOL_Rhmol05G0263700 [Rhododendron molle]|uniref:Uncharacterized protein n=1 Tax=Rhododendron molle TaxID=49168 RepID=A0ACC0NT82_RHOML|nr:hypothetical protein RHMOL_Rhmol05G0263700 [Rhododendron molle]